jgi:hypothetical protein
MDFSVQTKIVLDIEIWFLPDDTSLKWSHDEKVKSKTGVCTLKTE